MGTSLTPDTEFHQFISYIYEWGISLGGIAVFIMLVWAGIQYLTSAGDPKKMRDSITRIQSSIVGLILLLTSWLVLNTINPQLVRLDPLPYRWPTRGLSRFEIDIAQMEFPSPCDFVLIWPTVNREGSEPSKPLRFEENQRSIVIEGSDALDALATPLMSADSFIKLSADELEIVHFERLGGEGFSIQPYNERGEPVDNGLYKKGGFCAIDLFQTTAERGVCGGNMGRVALPSDDFRLAHQRIEDITCIEIVQLTRGD